MQNLNQSFNKQSLTNIDINVLKEELKRRKQLKKSEQIEPDPFIEQDKRDKERVARLLREITQAKNRKKWSI